MCSVDIILKNAKFSGAARRQRPEARGRYSVSVTTAPPPRRPPKVQPPHQRPQTKLGGLGGLDSLLPSIFTGPPRGRGRGRSTVRRRRPKFIGPAKASDRQGNGDVRWGSVLSDLPQLRFERHPSVHKLFLNMWNKQNNFRQAFDTTLI